MKKVIGLSEFSIHRDEIIYLASLLTKYPKSTIRFNKDFAGCYYEGDEPSYQLIIDGFENDD